MTIAGLSRVNVNCARHYRRFDYRTTRSAGNLIKRQATRLRMVSSVRDARLFEHATLRPNAVCAPAECERRQTAHAAYRWAKGWPQVTTDSAARPKFQMAELSTNSNGTATMPYILKCHGAFASLVPFGPNTTVPLSGTTCFQIEWMRSILFPGPSSA